MYDLEFSIVIIVLPILLSLSSEPDELAVTGSIEGPTYVYKLKRAILWF